MRRLRAALMLALTWGVMWAAIAAIIAVIEYAGPLAADGVTGAIMSAVGMQALAGFVAGAICGVLFSLLLAAFQRRGRLETLSLLRVGLLGALATGWLGLLYGDAFFAPALAATTSLPLALASLALSSALLGGVSAAVTLHLARRAPRTLAAPDPRRLDA